MGRIVAVTSHPEPVSVDGVTLGHQVVPDLYLKAVRKAGGVPVILALDDPSTVADALDRVDALVVTGGLDVDPAAYGQPRSEQLGATNPVRDAGDLAAVRAAVARDLPTLCVCRGIQVLNVALGGTLVQHVDDHMRLDRYNDDVHEVAIEPGSRLASIVGTTRLGVNSLHHQVIDELGDGVQVVARNPDGHPEAVEVAHAPHVLGVQWHPEMLRHRPEQLALFSALLG